MCGLRVNGRCHHGQRTAPRDTSGTSSALRTWTEMPSSASSAAIRRRPAASAPPANAAGSLTRSVSALPRPSS